MIGKIVGVILAAFLAPTLTIAWELGPVSAFVLGFVLGGIGVYLGDRYDVSRQV